MQKLSWGWKGRRSSSGRRKASNLSSMQRNRKTNYQMKNDEQAARSELAPQLERLSKERDEEKVRADFADLAADNRGRVIESLEHQLAAANERLARLEDGHRLLIVAFQYIGKDIKRRPLNDTAGDGIQALSWQIAEFLDSTALSASSNNGSKEKDKS